MSAASSPTPDFSAIKGRQQQTWAAGDYQRIAATFVLDSELLCEAVDVQAGQRVLDVAGGTGNIALAAARRFADVTCTDYVPALLEVARIRADAEGLSMAIQEADAENLPFSDASFDVVLSMFGSIFAPNQAQAARELLRVCRPGGRVGMANWSPEGFVGQFFQTMARFVPPPPGLASPLRWGAEAGLRELFGDGVRDLAITRRQHVYRFESPAHWIEYFRAYFGPTTKAFEALDPAGQEQLTSALSELISRFLRPGKETAVWDAEYLEVVATRA